MREDNPYTPGAGFMPSFLAGRDNLIQQIDFSLASIQKGRPQRSVLYYGLRGVGKTVLLNTIERAADNRNILHEYIEATEDAYFRKRLTAAIAKLISQLSVVEAAKTFVQKGKALLKAFRLTYGIENSEVSIDIGGKPLETTGIYEDDLTDIIVQLGRAAEKSEAQVCLLIDEMQYLENEDIAALVGALHRCNQLRLPVVMFCAGLPKLRKMVGEAKTYSERLFFFEEIGALEPIAAVDAIVCPAEEYGVKYDNAAIQEIISVTGKYPYFLQELCSTIWMKTSGDLITEADVFAATDDFYTNLDRGFFSVRYERCSNSERDFMTAMVICGGLPCAISNVAEIMGKTVKSISPTRGKLINKGLIYAAGHAEIDFTVPKFDAFIPDLLFTTHLKKD